MHCTGNARTSEKRCKGHANGSYEGQTVQLLLQCAKKSGGANHACPHACRSNRTNEISFPPQETQARWRQSKVPGRLDVFFFSLYTCARKDHFFPLLTAKAARRLGFAMISTGSASTQITRTCMTKQLFSQLTNTSNTATCQ